MGRHPLSPPTRSRPPAPSQVPKKSGSETVGGPQEAGDALGDAALWAQIEHDSARRLLRAAVECFGERGYHATTTRQISERARMAPTAMYAHFHSKLDLLVTISELGHRASLEDVEAAADAGKGPVDRLYRYVHAFVAWHARNQTIGRVAQYELNSLPPERSVEVRRLRRAIDHRLRELLQSGMDASQFEIDDLKLTSISILSLGIDVARWYAGTPDADALGTTQAGLVMKMIGVAPRFPGKEVGDG